MENVLARLRFRIANNANRRNVNVRKHGTRAIAGLWSRRLIARSHNAGVQHRFPLGNINFGEFLPKPTLYIA
jgi:hypothetical protein